MRENSVNAENHHACRPLCPCCGGGDKRPGYRYAKAKSRKKTSQASRAKPKSKDHRHEHAFEKLPERIKPGHYSRYHQGHNPPHRTPTVSKALPTAVAHLKEKYSLLPNRQTTTRAWYDGFFLHTHKINSIVPGSTEFYEEVIVSIEVSDDLFCDLDLTTSSGWYFSPAQLHHPEEKYAEHVERDLAKIAAKLNGIGVIRNLGKQRREVKKVREIGAGNLFYAIDHETGSMAFVKQECWLKLYQPSPDSFNAVNLATWTACTVPPDTLVVDRGMMAIATSAAVKALDARSAS